MKKNFLKFLVIIIGIIIILSTIIYFGYTNIYLKKHTNTSTKDENTSESIKFKEDYEAQNTTKDDNGNLKYISMNLPEKMPFKYASIDDIFNLFSNGTGVIYFGMPECNWCRAMLPTLIEVANEKNIDTILYFNPKQIRSDNTEEYQKLVKLLEPFLKTDTTTQKETEVDFDKNKKRLYLPDVYIVKNGKIMGNHADTVDTQEDPKIEFTDSQRTELKNIFIDLLSKISNKTCNETTNEGC